jgi:hypothetical protein
VVPFDSILALVEHFATPLAASSEMAVDSIEPEVFDSKSFGCLLDFADSTESEVDSKSFGCLLDFADSMALGCPPDFADSMALGCPPDFADSTALDCVPDFVDFASVAFPHCSQTIVEVGAVLIETRMEFGLA